IIAFQEVRDYAGGYVKADLERILNPLGYRFQVQEGSPHGQCVINVMAYKIDKVWPKQFTPWWNSETPDQSSDSYGNGWPRAVLSAEFFPIKKVTVERSKQGTGEPVSFSRPAPNYEF